MSTNDLRSDLYSTKSNFSQPSLTGNVQITVSHLAVIRVCPPTLIGTRYNLRRTRPVVNELSARRHVYFTAACVLYDIISLVAG